MLLYIYSQDTHLYIYLAYKELNSIIIYIPIVCIIGL